MHIDGDSTTAEKGPLSAGIPHWTALQQIVEDEEKAVDLSVSYSSDWTVLASLYSEGEGPVCRLSVGSAIPQTSLDSRSLALHT